MSELAEQYKNASNLNARIALHSRFGKGGADWYPWLFEHLDVPDGARVLELGCGSAKLWRENSERIPENWDITLTDVSAGMVDEAKGQLRGVPRNFHYAVVDVQAMPFEAQAFDVVIAVHMLYHVPNQDRALSEIQRVLKPEGRFYASTNSRNNMREIGDLAIHLTDGKTLEAIRSMHTRNSFRLEDGEKMLSPYFADVRLHRLDSSLEVTEVEPLLAYILSGTATTAMRERPNDEQQRQLEAFRRYLEKQIAREGAIHITRATGLFEARV